MRFTCFASMSRSERFVKDEAIKKTASITMAMPDRTTSRLVKEPLKAEFTPIYISFYNSFTMKGNVVAYVWICEVKTFLLKKLYQTNTYDYETTSSFPHPFKTPCIPGGIPVHELHNRQRQCWCSCKKSNDNDRALTYYEQ